MKKTIYALVIVCALVVPAIAGDTQLPGKQDPPCTQNCATATSTDPITGLFIEVVLSLITLRP